jgi:hypothetical protein
MELKPYFYKQRVKDTHSDYGKVAISLEKCPNGTVELMGCACTFHSCCKDHKPHMRIVETPYCWIQCEATTKMMERDPTLGQVETCRVK